MATSRKNMTEQEWQLLRNIGEMFKDKRIEAGLSQKQASRTLGTAQARASTLENGGADVMVTTLNRWANLYGYEVQISLVPIEDEFDKALREAAEELEAEENAA